MKDIPRFSKIFMFLSLLAGTLWVGAYLTRLFLSYQLFEAEDLSLKAYITSENMNGILVTLLPAITTTFVLYLIFIFSFIIFLVASKISLKKNGWLFIIVLLVFVTLPFEAYLMTLDYNLITLLNAGSFESTRVVELFTDRIKVLSSFPLVEVFCYFAIVYLVLFQPLTVKEKL